jgi:hypothetical protein
MSVIPEESEWEPPFGFLSMLRWWGFIGIGSMIQFNDLVPMGFDIFVLPLMIVAFFFVERILRDKRIEKVAEAEGKFTEDELRHMLDSSGRDW